MLESNHTHMLQERFDVEDEGRDKDAAAAARLIVAQLLGLFLQRCGWRAQGSITLGTPAAGPHVQPRRPGRGAARLEPFFDPRTSHELVFAALVMFDLLVKAQTLAAATHQQLSSGQWCQSWHQYSGDLLCWTGLSTAVTDSWSNLSQARSTGESMASTNLKMLNKSFTG